MVDVTVQLNSLDLGRLDRLAAAMLSQLPSPLVLGLVGTLGAGKTTFVQGLARAAGIDPAEVTSPTFTLLQTHRGSVVLHHLDAYRLADDEEFLQLGVDELFDDPNTWIVIEWADRVRDVLPQDTLWIELIHGSQAATRDVHLRTSRKDLRTPLEQLEPGIGT